MKANNLSVSIPYRGCNKDCPYCVSKMTGYVKTDVELFNLNMKKARQLAYTSEVSSVSITGKGEPLLNLDTVRTVANYFNRFPVELQTNGLLLIKNLTWIDLLILAGVDIFAISMDKISDFELMQPVIDHINKLNRTVRVTMNVSDMLPHPDAFGFLDYIHKCKVNGIQQFTFRNLTIPSGVQKINETAMWIKNHTRIDSNTEPYYDQLIREFKEKHDDYRLLRDLNYGAELYDVEGIAFTFIGFCMQDTVIVDNSIGARSLIYQDDGHMYTNWDSLASRIF